MINYDDRNSALDEVMGEIDHRVSKIDDRIDSRHCSSDERAVMECVRAIYFLSEVVVIGLSLALDIWKDGKDQKNFRK